MKCKINRTKCVERQCKANNEEEMTEGIEGREKGRKEGRMDGREGIRE